MIMRNDIDQSFKHSFVELFLKIVKLIWGQNYIICFQIILKT